MSRVEQVRRAVCSAIAVVLDALVRISRVLLWQRRARDQGRRRLRLLGLLDRMVQQRRVLFEVELPCDQHDTGTHKCQADSYQISIIVHPA
ncbi:hypothetical protein XH80_15225 [Bradyrhizobium sp. CCBAU 45384]|nr:hypothetical protein [Bradyrhizobium sp. CCBAU 45384]